MVTRTSGRHGLRGGAGVAFAFADRPRRFLGRSAARGGGPGREGREGRDAAALGAGRSGRFSPRRFRLGARRGRRGSAPWDGALGAGITRALFGTYRVVLSSQDLPVCGFTPSCSRFSERAIDRCGPLQGALLSLDRLLRDHPLALPFYPRAADGHMKDDPDRYCLTAPE